MQSETLNSSSLRILGMCSSIGVVLFFLYLAATAALNRARLDGSNTWPTVEGRMLRTMVESSRGRGASPTKYLPQLYFEYTVAGTKYVGQTSALEQRKFSSLKLAQNYAAGFGSRLEVRVNPLNPSQACVECRFDATAYRSDLRANLIIASLFLGYFFYSLITSRRKRRVTS